MSKNKIADRSFNEKEKREKLKNPDPEDEGEEQDEGYTCSKCCNQCCHCTFVTIRFIYNILIIIISTIVGAFAWIWYPIKERCVRCCDNCDKKFNPYKDPFHNPYDTL